jgi:putative glutathione S-transferase
MTEAPAPFRIGKAEERDGAFHRQESQFRSWVTADGSSGFAPEAGRYHLYVARACPWAHRTIIGRELMGLEEVISISFVDPIRDQYGWAFTEPGRYEDPISNSQYLAEVYNLADPDFSDRVTVPVLWDRERKTIVNNESSEIFRMLHTVFAPLAEHPVELFPEAYAAAIDELNARVYDAVNNGVYKAGFSKHQRIYEHAVLELFAVLDELTTLIRFDAVYQIHFKCSIRKIAEYPNLWPYLRDLYQWPGIAATVSFAEIRDHYYRTHGEINPSGLVAVMPGLDFDEPPGRERL